MKSAPIKPTISIEDLQKIDIRVGTIRSVEDVPKSNKLVRLTVDFGDHSRTILAGMKQEWENPSEIEGRQALFRGCCSTSDTRTGSPRCWQFPRNPSPTVPARDRDIAGCTR